VETDVPFGESPYGIETSGTVSAVNPDNPQQRGMLCTNPR